MRGWWKGIALVLVAALAVALAACLDAQSRNAAYTAEDAAVVTDWIDGLYGVVRVERYSPPKAARVFAYSGVAFYEAMVHGLPELQSLAGQLNGLERLPQPEAGVRYDWPTAAVAAQAHVMAALLADVSPASQVQLEHLAQEHFVARRATGVSVAVMERSQAYGQALAEALAAWAATDGYAATRNREYERPHGGPHSWVPTATAAQNTALMASPAADFVDLGTNAGTERGLAPEMVSERMLVVNRPDSWLNPHRALEPYWSELRPFVLSGADVCQPAPPMPYSMEPGSPFAAQVEAVYQTSQALTDEQATIARYWSDCPGYTGTPPGHWARIMSQLVEQHGLSLQQTVEMYATVGIGMHDAFVSAWDEKYRSNLVRPITVIQERIDPSWQTIVVTPPFPEFTSGHSVVSGASAELLTHLLGEGVAFTDRTQAFLGFEDRTFASFREAAREAADSRLYGGIHYPMSNERGLTQGRCVAERVLGQIQTRAVPAAEGLVARAE